MNKRIRKKNFKKYAGEIAASAAICCILSTKNMCADEIVCAKRLLETILIGHPNDRMRIFEKIAEDALSYIDIDDPHYNHPIADPLLIGAFRIQNTIGGCKIKVSNAGVQRWRLKRQKDLAKIYLEQRRELCRINTGYYCDTGYWY